MLKKIINFFTRDIWRLQLRKLPPSKSFLIKQLRIVLVSFRGFDEDKCQLRASALTFYSLLSSVPIIAMAFGIAKGFGLENMLEKQLLEKMPGQEEVLTQVMSFARSLLENTKGGVIAGIGVAILFWTVIKMLGNIEKSFNDIWGIKEGRALGRRFSDYLSIMLICPILVILSSSATVFISSQITLLTEKIAVLGTFSPMILFIVNLLPYCVIWVLFSFLYIFMPNTKVNLSSGILAGVAAGTIYQLTQWAYVNFQMGVAKYNAIYGSFAALPLFLVWLQLSWLIILFGAEIAFAHQNVDTYEFEPDCLGISNSFKTLLSLQITHLLVKNFTQCAEPLSAKSISHRLELPIRLVRQILYDLTEANITAEVVTHPRKEPAYHPSCDIDKFSIKHVVDALNLRGSDTLPVPQTPELTAISESLKTFGETIEKSAANKLLKDI